MFETLIVERDGAIVTVKLDRPKALNSINFQMVKELETLIGELRADDGVRAVIITGNHEKSFCAGADIEELAGLDPRTARAAAGRGQAVFRNIETMGKPVLAAVNGFALGGGCEMAMACTLRVAAERAKLGQPEVNLGIIPGYGGTQRLPRLVGKGRAMDLILTGRVVKAQEALEIGLVNRVVAGDELMQVTREMAETLLSKAPLALEYAMEAVHRGLECGFEDGCALEADLFGLGFATEDSREGLEAFREKRAAAFKGK